MSIARERLSSGESRAVALAAARQLLVTEGPQAVTLKAVAAKIGKTHANLLHHFGSAAELQSSLAQHIAESVTANIGDAVQKAREGTAAPAEIINRTFDAFDREGAGALAAWMILTGNRDALDPVLEAIHQLVTELGGGSPELPISEITLSLVLMALGDSLLGAPLCSALDLPRQTVRQLALRNLLASVGYDHYEK